MRKEKKLGVLLYDEERALLAFREFFGFTYNNTSTDGRIMQTMLYFFMQIDLFPGEKPYGYVWNGTRPYSYDLNRWLESLPEKQPLIDNLYGREINLDQYTGLNKISGIVESYFCDERISKILSGSPLDKYLLADLLDLMMSLDFMRRDMYPLHEWSFIIKEFIRFRLVSTLYKVPKKEVEYAQRLLALWEFAGSGKIRWRARP